MIPTGLPPLPDVAAAARRIATRVLCTPLRRSAYLSQQYQAEVHLKCENLQHTGAFKVRGAFNALLARRERGALEEVITASTGNHGAAVAFAAAELGVRCTVYVPRGAAPGKLAKIRARGAEVMLFGDDGVDAEHEARRVAETRGLPYLSPYNDPDVIAGQGTIGLELLQQLPQLDGVLVAVGGGGLISGIASACKIAVPPREVIGCSPARSAVMHHSVIAGRILADEGLQTLSDATAGGVEATSMTLPLCRALVDRWVLVEEQAIRAGIRTLHAHEAMLVEGAAGVAVAGLAQLGPAIAGRTLAVVLCGGNIDPEVAAQVLG